MGFKFNGVHSDTYGLKVKNYQKPILPPVSVSFYDVPYTAGGYQFNHKLQTKDIVVSVYFQETSDANFEAKVRQLASWLYSITPKQLILDEEPSKYYNVILNGESGLEQLLYMGSAELTFTCSDPFAYKTTQDTTTWATGTNTNTISNDGTDTFPVLSFTAWATAITLKNTTTGKLLSLSGLTVGDVLSVDNSRGIITKNSKQTNANLSMDSEFFPLVSGNNQLDCGATTHNTITINYRKRYL